MGASIDCARRRRKEVALGDSDSPTRKYLSQRMLRIEVPKRRRAATGNGSAPFTPGHHGRKRQQPGQDVECRDFPLGTLIDLCYRR